MTRIAFQKFKSCHAVVTGKLLGESIWHHIRRRLYSLYDVQSAEKVSGDIFQGIVIHVVKIAEKFCFASQEVSSQRNKYRLGKLQSGPLSELCVCLPCIDGLFLRLRSRRNSGSILESLSTLPLCIG